MRKYLALLCFVFALALGHSAPALAQACGVNYVPQVGINCANIRQPTYSAAIKSLVPQTTAATDFFCINGSATKNVNINRIEISGTGTAATQVVYLNHNLGLDTGTRAVAATYGPIPYPLSSTSAAASAATIAYNSTGGNPTIGGTATLIRSGELGVVAATVGIPAPALVWTFGGPSDPFNQRLRIPSGGTTEQYCLNFAGATVTAAVLQGYIEWTED